MSESERVGAACQSVFALAVSGSLCPLIVEGFDKFLRLSAAQKNKHRNKRGVSSECEMSAEEAEEAEEAGAGFLNQL